MGDQKPWSTPSFSSSPSTFRFLNNLKQPDPDPLPLNNTPPLDDFELDEDDVVFSSDDITTAAATIDPISSSPPPPHPLLRQARFNPTIPGLSAALSDDSLHPLIRRKSTLNPSHSATKAIPHLKSQTHSSSKFHQSAPVDVPVWPTKIGINKKDSDYLDKFDEVDDELDGDDEMVPPHVIIARSHVTFSVFEGVGRTLKGRDLRRVRNAVFQKTGFID